MTHSKRMNKIIQKVVNLLISCRLKFNIESNVSINRFYFDRGQQY